MTITSKYNGKCKKCGGAISQGEEIEWSKENGSTHIDCPAQPQKTFKPQPKPGQQPRFHNLEKAYLKAEQAVNPQSDPYWQQLYQQAESEVELCTAN